MLNTIVHIFCFRFKIHLCTDIVRKIILSNIYIYRCIDSIIVEPNICQVSVGTMSPYIGRIKLVSGNTALLNIHSYVHCFRLFII